MKVRTQLRNMGLVDTTLDELREYEWSLSPRKAFEKLSSQLRSADAHIRAKSETAMDDLRRIVHFCDKFGVARKIFITPHSCNKSHFYATGFIFTVAVPDKKSKRVIAAGGRYDSLIKAQHSPDARLKQGAVGFQIGIDSIVALLAQNGAGSKSGFLKNSKQIQQLPKRCDVLVVTDGMENTRERAIDIVKSLWEQDIRAELSRAHGSIDTQDYVFTAHLRHETSTTVRVARMDTPDDVEVDVPIPALPAHIVQELRDRAQSKARIPLLRSQSSHHDGDERKVS